ncbi:hypothetical protein T265_11920 [Opisthorchis viverrini]|uniref:Uncharacterized protein n=1 Tax=Opisthorchis viverrini TaxID=6198 RepID=A0A074YWT4_OPIVI|nr:hypothetical protein T265_11920 [Opisthorchis viverrini]KER19246.1 hypothetical protein T265_11920 [Opisthorchis viverrini]
MDPQLRPRFFDADPNSADAAKRWNHWFRTFETYLKTVESSKPDKLETLIHFFKVLLQCWVGSNPRLMLAGGSIGSGGLAGDDIISRIGNAKSAFATRRREVGLSVKGIVRTVARRGLYEQMLRLTIGVSKALVGSGGNIGLLPEDRLIHRALFALPYVEWKRARDGQVTWRQST